ncbi:MAG: NAD(P)H-hydrate dehydratase [Pseudomonadales bacterium]
MQPFQADARETRLYSAEQVRELDRIAIEELAIPGIVLMKRAGLAVYEAISMLDSSRARLSVLCGRGNNAGDGYIVAGIALDQGLEVQLLQLGSSDALSGDAARARDWALGRGVVAEQFACDSELRGDVVVDSLLGTGLVGTVRDEFVAAIDAINRCARSVIAVDVPSGLCADTGAPLGCAVNANLTVTFIGRKRGLYTGAGKEHAGQVVYADLDVNESAFARVPVRVELLRLGENVSVPQRRRRDAHKGSFGHVLVVGGDLGMGGAALMAAEAAMRTGAGLTSVATRAEHISGFLARRPELMVRGVGNAKELSPLIERATVVVVGPGLGRAAFGEQLLKAALDSRKAMVLDADALNILADRGWSLPPPSVITPHPGEASRLLGWNTQAVVADRFAAIEALIEKFRCAVVLKGAGTLVGDPDSRIGVCEAGNPGMASGGMGDVLSGVVGGLLAQGLSAIDAARVGVCVHACAADAVAAQAGERGLLATDLIADVRRILNT